MWFVLQRRVLALSYTHTFSRATPETNTFKSSIEQPTLAKDTRRRSVGMIQRQSSMWFAGFTTECLRKQETRKKKYQMDRLSYWYSTCAEFRAGKYFSDPSLRQSSHATAVRHHSGTIRKARTRSVRHERRLYTLHVPSGAKHRNCAFELLTRENLRTRGNR